MKKKIFLVFVLIVVIIIGFLWWRENRIYNGPVQNVKADQAQIEKGKYIAIAADCTSCHTSANGAPFAGGYPIKTNFGTMYSSNITPSADFGIGRWTKDDFYAALTKGITPTGGHLYPSMPYTSYKGISREDSDNLYAYLMTREAIDISPPENEMSFPFNQRMLMIGWNLLFDHGDTNKSSSKGQSVQWQRGRYLVNVLEHCGECHTPRGIFGQIDHDKTLQGSPLGQYYAPDITTEGLASRGWTADNLLTYFQTGISKQGAAFSEMYPVVINSTQYLTKDDQNAIVTYLTGDHPIAPVNITSKAGNPNGRDIYVAQCAACHGIEGQGIPNVSVDMQNNTTLRDPNAINLIRVIWDGIDSKTFPGGMRFQSMPAFAKRLDDAQIADLVNYLQATWGGLEGNISTKDIERMRAQ